MFFPQIVTAGDPEVIVCQMDLIKRVSRHKLEALNWPENTDMTNMLAYLNESIKRDPHAD